MADNYYEPSNGVAEPISQHEDAAPVDNGYPVDAANGAPVPTNGHGANGGLNGAAAPALVRKTLASWVGFSNLPNQVHRRSVR